MDRREMLQRFIAGSAAVAASDADATKGEGAKPAQYAIVELMGYTRLCGLLTPGPMGMWQLDIPVEGGFVRKLFNRDSVYAITYCDADAVREYAAGVDPLPKLTLTAPESPPRRLWHHNEDDFDDN